MSNRPSLKIEMPAPQPAEFRRPSAAIRIPRFTEDFDASFSEALVNEPQTTTATTTPSSSSESGSCSSYSCVQSRASYDFSTSRKVSPSSAVRTPSFPQSPSEQWQQQTESRRRTNVTGRVREWARRSMILGRGRPASTYEPVDRPSTTKSSNGSDDGTSDRGSQ